MATPRATACAAAVKREHDGQLQQLKQVLHAKHYLGCKVTMPHAGVEVVVLFFSIVLKCGCF